VGRRLFHGEWPLGERDVIAVEEVLGNVRRLVRSIGKLCIGGDVNAVQGDFAVVGISEGGAVNSEA